MNNILDRLIYITLIICAALVIAIITVTIAAHNDQTDTLGKQQSELDMKSKLITQQAQHIEELKKSAKTLGTELIGTDFEVTYYNACCITKSGKTVTNGVTVAVDPEVIPIGSWVRLTFADGRTLIRRADDTGGAVKGHIVDVYADESDKTLRGYGRDKNVKVEVLEGE